MSDDAAQHFVGDVTSVPAREAACKGKGKSKGYKGTVRGDVPGGLSTLKGRLLGATVSSLPRKWI